MIEYIELRVACQAMRRLQLDDVERYGVSLFDCFDANRAIAELISLPTADVVEVVRCKDCKYYKATHFKTFDGEVHVVKYCHRFGFPFDPNDYCSYGKGGDL